MRENKEINILAIETSCDETSVAILKGPREVLSNVISSQIDIHKEFGGVVPEIASRHHIQNITTVLDEALEESKMDLSEIDLICVTYGPGLVGALLVGVSFAKALAYSLNIPIVGVNHIEGHIAANYITSRELEPPFISLVVSGGHSHIIKVNGYNEFEIIGKTRDDAVGEAFDKVARVLGLGYPGGPKIDKLAKEGKNRYKLPKTKFDNLDFSFSGIKTAVLNTYNSSKQKGEDINIEDMCCSFQSVVVEELIENSIKACKQEKIDKLVLAGGVSANSYLRQQLNLECEKESIKVYMPEFKLCMDNAAMIGSAGYYKYIAGKQDNLILNAKPNLRIGE